MPFGFRVRFWLARFVFTVTMLAPVGPAQVEAQNAKVMPRGPVAASATPRRRAAERTLLAIQQDAARRVQTLVERMKRLPNGPARDALEREAQAIKRESEQEMQRARLGFERAGAGAETSPPPRVTGAGRAGALLDCVDDSLEPNDVCSAASPVATGTYSPLQSLAANDDWYRITVQRNGTLTVSLAFTNANGNLDMRLFDGCPGSQVGISAGTTDGESITYKNTGTTRDFYVRVYLSSGTCNTYSMTLAISGFAEQSKSSVIAPLLEGRLQAPERFRFS